MRHEVEYLDQLHNCSTSVKDPVKEMHRCHVVEEVESCPVIPKGHIGDLKDHDQDLDCSEGHEHDRKADDWAELNAADAMMRARLVLRLNN